MQESRLFKIVYHLLDKGQTTAAELAQMLEVSVRTIYRDMDALSEAGIPIYAEAGRNGGIRLMKDFVLDKAVLSDREKRDILSSLQNLAVTNSDHAQDTLKKLSALFHLPAENWYETDFSRWGCHTHDQDKFELLKHAVIHHRVVKVLYVNSYGGRDERNIQPLKLLYKSKEWYIKAFCMKKQDFRLFKLNRIIEYTLSDEIFQPMPFPEKEASPVDDVFIRLRFAKEAAYRAYDEFEECRIEHLENGDIIASAQMPVDSWLTGYLLSFGTQIEVIEPLFLRDILAKQAAEIYRKYTASADIDSCAEP